MKIKFLNGIYSGRELEFNTPSVTIGRDGGNQLILDTDGVSRCHAELKQLPDGSWVVQDLNSTNGVKVNGVRIDGPAPVGEGTALVIGENHLLVTALSQEPAPVIFNPIISPGIEPDVPEPQPEVPETPRSSAPAGESAWDPKKLTGSLFGKKESKKSSESVTVSTAADSRKRRSNRIFYTIVVCVVIMVLSFAFSMMTPKKKAVSAVRELPLVVQYEKEIISSGNVFRFEFLMKSRYAERTVKKNGKNVTSYGREYTVTLSLDDIASGRRFSREVPVSDETVNQLRSVISSSGIFAAPENRQLRHNSVNRLLTVVEGRRLAKVAVAGEYGPNEFTAVEEAINEMTESFGLKTISMTPEQLRTQAERDFIKAEDLFANSTLPGNLRDAIKRYQMVVESLEQFDPKPAMWDRARKQLAEALKQRTVKMDALQTEYKRLAQMGEFGQMRGVFLQMMDLSDPESPEYSSAKRRLVYIEQILRKKSGR